MRKPWIPEKYRTKVSKLYLDIAEGLPKTASGPIAHLQLLREYQRKNQEKAFEDTRPPNGNNLTFLYFRLYETFFIEDFSQVQHGIEKMFPTFNELYNREHFQHLSGYGELGYEGSWSRVGTVYRINIGGKQPVYRIQPDLPETISRIDVGIQKILPSVLVLTFDVILTDIATSHIKKLNRQKNLSEIQFSNLIPWRLHRSSSVTYPANKVLERELVSYIAKQRQAVEKFIKGFLGGYFSENDNITSPTFSAVEVFSVKVPEDNYNKLTKWTFDVRLWLQAIGFPIFGGYYFDKNQMLFLHDRSGWYDKLIHKRRPRLLVFLETYLEGKSLDMFHGDTNHAVKSYTNELLQNITLQIVMLEFVQQIKSTTEKLRISTRGKKSRVKVHKDSVHLNKRIYDAMTMNTLVIAEFKDLRNRTDIRPNAGDDLLFTSPSGKTYEKYDFHKNILDEIENQLKRIDANLANTEKSYTNYLALQNMAGIYWLQSVAAISGCVTVALTILVVILAILTVVANDQVIEVINQFLMLLSN